MQGISRFRDLVRSTFESSAISKDPSGFVAQVLKEVQAAERKAQKIEIDVENKQELVLKLEADAEKMAESLAKKLNEGLLNLLDTEAIAQKVIDEIKAFQNESNP